MPTFWQGENLIHFAAFKKHVGVFPGDLTRTPFAEKLADYHTTKGAIQFPYNKPVPFELIAEIAAYRVKAAAEKLAEKQAKKRSKKV
jgi:uncharacterized protein YdhG (YjbR/CyaY superfamily)